MRSAAVAAGSRATSKGHRSAGKTPGMTDRSMMTATPTEAAAGRIILWMSDRWPGIFEDLSELRTERLISEIEDLIGGSLNYRKRADVKRL